MCTACACTTDTSSETGTEAANESAGEVSEFTVIGMTCGHCVNSVTEQIQQIDGVRDIALDLATGAMTVTADPPITADAVSAAVREAGYQVV